MFSFILSTALALPQSYSISPIAMVEPENEEVSDDSQEEGLDVAEHGQSGYKL